MLMPSLQNFVHATTAQLSGHVQNFVVITSSELYWKQNEKTIKFKLQWIKIEWNRRRDFDVVWLVNVAIVSGEPPIVMPIVTQ